MKNISAGLLLYRQVNGGLEVFLAHPGGPFFKNKRDGWWTIPKGQVNIDEDKLEAAKREFEEEIGYKLGPSSKYIPLGNIKQKGGKVVYCWAVEGNIDKSHRVQSSSFSIEWPPRSGKKIDVPEIDEAEFFTIEEAKVKMIESQLPLIERLAEYLEET